MEWQRSSNVKIYYAQTWYYGYSLTGVYYIVDKKGSDGATALTIISDLKQEVMTYSLTPDVISANKPLVSKQNSASIV